MLGLTYILTGCGYIIAGVGYWQDDNTNNTLAIGCATIGIGFISIGIVNLITS